MVGVKLVYEDREVNIYNNMVNSNPIIEVVNATGMQVSIGCYSGLLAMEYHRNKLKSGIVWGQDYLFEGSKLNNVEKDDFSDIILTVLKGVGFELTEEIYNESMGLVKDRIVNEHQKDTEFKDILSKIKVNKFDETEYGTGIFTYKDTNIQEIESLLYKTYFENASDDEYEYAIIAINDFIIKGDILNISETSYDDLLDTICEMFETHSEGLSEEYINEYYSDNNHIRNTDLSLIEDALLSDGYDVQEISKIPYE